MSSLPILEQETFNRYSGLSLPRHVSYPMPNWWTPLDSDEVRGLWADVSAPDRTRDLSLYLHLPFCQSLCKFCGCNRTIVRKESKGARDRTRRYMEALLVDVRSRGAMFDGSRVVRQVHWGGGTPTYLDSDEIRELHNATREAFNIADDAEVSIEVDPRVTTREQLETLRDLGFNRISLGVQDFKLEVQKHVNRVQPFEMVEQIVNDCREVGFESVNFDLIYGLPYQTVASVKETVSQAITLSPDRFAFYHYAQIPEKLANQRGIHHEAMADSETKLEMFLSAVELFEEAGYSFIGLDHFAKSDEMLTRAVKDKTVHRTFQGMTTGAALDLIGLGASSISTLHEIGFLHNIRNPDEYADAIEAGEEVTHRGMRLSRDDVVRQKLINDLYSHGAIVPHALEEQFGIDYSSYFAREIEKLDILETDGLVTVDADGGVELTFPLGRVLMRNVAALFDAYLSDEAYLKGERHLYSVNA
ncbi:MAG: oxygen-independent coproporphyrinogen III oxidase [Acidobacteria bacterium]|nr:oxygen-independent coproporphyrinogen III oxidase [Acidobacteriota bacterium]